MSPKIDAFDAALLVFGTLYVKKKKKSHVLLRLFKLFLLLLLLLAQKWFVNLFQISLSSILNW